MRKSIRPIVSVLALFIVIGAIFFAGKPELSSAQNAPFKSYQLRVFCGNSAIPTEAFWHDVGEDSMGVHVRCAGNCDGGKVPLADALAGLPAAVSTALKAMVEKHQENAAAGKGRSLTCLRDGKEPPPDDKCDTKKACDAIRDMQNLIARYEALKGFNPGSFARFDQELGPLLQALSEALACRFGQGPSNADQLKDFTGQLLRDKNSFKTLNNSSQFPTNSACIDRLDGLPIRSSLADACADFDTIQRIKENLSRLASALGCPGGPTTPPPPARNICKPSEKKIEPGDEEAKNQLVGGIQAAIDELKNTAESIEGQGGAAAQRIEGIKKKIATYEKIKGFWENIKAGSCVPSDVYQTIIQVANDHRSNGYSENCPSLCRAATEWFGRINPGPQTGIQKKFFMETCMAYCN